MTKDCFAFVQDHLTRRVEKIVEEFGTDCYVQVGVKRDRYMSSPRPHASIFPENVLHSGCHGYGATLDEALDEALKKARAKEDCDSPETVRKMALAIIDKADGTGNCDTSALAASGFRSRQIVAMGPRAVEEANRLSGGRPFQLVTPEAVDLQAARRAG